MNQRKWIYNVGPGFASKDFYALLICSLLFFGCDKSPRLTISEEKMIELLMDAHILEASLSEVSKNVKDSMNLVYYQQFYTIHGVTKEEFYENLGLIQQNPKLTHRIYKVVQDSLERRSTRVEKEKKKEEESWKRGRAPKGQKK